MDYHKILLIGFIIFGLLYQGYSKALANTSTEDDYLDDDYNENYDEEDEENRSKPDTNDISNNDAVHQDPPRLKYDRDSTIIEAKPGDNVILPCEVENIHKTNVVLWYNRTQVIVQNRNILTQSRIKTVENDGIKITNVTPYDTSVYKCSVLPDIEYTVNLIVEKENVKISVNERQANQHESNQQFTFRQGESVLLECKYSGPETDVKIKWSLNSGSIHQHGAHVENDHINIKHIDAKHAGTYQCLGDINGKTNGLPFTSVDIVVLHKPKTSTHRHHVNTKIGDHAILTCDYHSNPIATVEWIHNSNIIPMISEKYKIKGIVHNHRNRTSLHISNISQKDLGTYICEAKNALGTDTSKVHVILEPERPVFEKHDIDGRLVNLFWLTRSTTLLMDAVLDYKLNRSSDWMTEAAFKNHKHDDGQSSWKIHHKLEVPTGEWEARVRVKNQYGWSEFSKPFTFNITDEEKIIDDEVAPVVTELPAPVDIVKPTESEEEVDKLLRSGFGHSAASHLTVYTVMPLTILVLSIFNLVPSLFRNL